MAIAEALQIGLQVAQGLAELHKIDVIHRDLKPSNILFDQQGLAKLADYGLAQAPGGLSMRSLMGSLTPAHPGTPGYMSPEQENTTAYLKPPSDVYALGVVLFVCLTGRNPHNLRPGTAPASLRPQIPGWLDGLIVRMLAEDPQQRPWDASEVIERLDEGLQAKERQVDEARKREAAEDQARLEQEARKRKAVEEQARLEEEERQRKAAEDQVRREAEERQRKAALEQARLEQEARQRKAAEEQARKEAEEQALKEMTITLAAGVEMVLMRVPAGEFMMGSQDTDKGAYDNEKPLHQVHLDEYWIGKYPVTNRQFQAYFQQSGQPKGWKFERGQEQHPAVYVSWQDAAAFCAWAGKVSGQKLRLPSEAEWEKAARWTDQRIYPWGNQPPDKTLANYFEQFNGTTPVGKFSPHGDSPYGCADMAGNVWEWAADWYDENYYKKTPKNNPAGPAKGEARVLRGGSFLNYDWVVRCASRSWLDPYNRLGFIGFRVVASPIQL